MQTPKVVKKQSDLLPFSFCSPMYSQFTQRRYYPIPPTPPPPASHLPLADTHPKPAIENL